MEEAKDKEKPKEPAAEAAPEEVFRYLDPARITVARLPGGTWRAVIADDRTVLHARFVRSFPVSCRDQLIEVRDGAGKHVGMMRDLEGLDADSRRAVRAALEGHYFAPAILEVRALREVFETQIWEVRTDRGDMEFSVSDPNHNVRLLPPRRLLITDTDQNLYEIPDWKALDAASRLRIKDIAQVVPE